MRSGLFRTLRAKAREYAGGFVMVTITNARPDVSTDFAIAVAGAP